MKSNTVHGLKPRTSTDWESLKAYGCRTCLENCINHDREPWTDLGICRNCWRVPSLDGPDAAARHDLVDRLDLAHRVDGASDGEAERVSGGASATSAASAEPAGSDPLRVDPEAGAPAPDRREGAIFTADADR